MRITFLGTGTSVGVPAIGCTCPVCLSDNPRNKRRRSSLYVEAAGTHVLIDTPPDFRDQALAYKLRRVDAVLITHAHADHVFGFDDLRRFNTLQASVIPVFGDPATLDEMRRIFAYVFQPQPPGVYRPQVDMRPVKEAFFAGPVAVTPVPVWHGGIATLGYRLEAEGRTLGYVPDCQSMSAAAAGVLAGVDVMILDALRHTPHFSHAHLESSLAMLQRIGARRSFLTHMCHDLDHDTVQARMPPGVELAWDGLTVDW